MSMVFFSIVKANAEIARLKGELESAEGRFKEAIAQIEQHNAAAKDITDKADAAIADLTAKLAEANKEIAALREAEEAAGKKAADIVAAQGLPTQDLPKDSPAKAAASKIRREDFEKLSPLARMGHLRSGGIVTD